MISKPSKPLSCYYCEHALILPGNHATSFEPSDMPAADCTCLDVSSDLYALLEKKIGPRRFVMGESWLPYHCGHFMPRMIRVKCAHRRCLKVIVAPEWYAAKNMYIGPYDELCCSYICAEIVNRELLRGARIR